MDCWCKTYTIIVTVVHSVVKLHEDVAKNVHLFQACLIHTQRLNDVSTFSTLCVELVDFASDPVV